jgi:hypothetical protein
MRTPPPLKNGKNHVFQNLSCITRGLEERIPRAQANATALYWKLKFSRISEGAV